MGVVPTTGLFRDYQKFQNIMMPTTLVQRGLGIEQVLQVNSYDFNNVPADDLRPAAGDQGADQMKIRGAGLRLQAA